MVGDRITDIAAGKNAGCRTALVQTGQHAAPVIVTAEPLDPALKPDWSGADLAAAAQWILSA
jgi:ribonucleotide monophosphatase NagD (HAD superfamily)